MPLLFGRLHAALGLLLAAGLCYNAMVFED
jgi:hypothetical protein